MLSQISNIPASPAGRKYQIPNMYQRAKRVFSFGSFVPFDSFGTSQKGFTLIELLIVFSVIAIISTIGIASYQKYADAQKLQTAQMSIKTLLQDARSRAGSQVKPTGCGTFQGYEVRICSGGLTCNTPSANVATYELDALCSAVPNGILMSSGKLPTGVSIDPSTNPYSYVFIPITGGVVAGGTITLNGANSATQKITVSNVGVIQ